MDLAAAFPKATASTTVLGPETTSPPEKMPFTGVEAVSGSARRRPFLEIFFRRSGGSQPTSGT